MREDTERPSEFPRSANYDPAWVLENMMGPNPLWLTESLSGCMDLDSTMRILDLGCGKALSSIFLAREYGPQVWAADLWIDASDNLDRIRAAGVDGRVFPIRADAHQLPFADGFFDAVVSIDAYHYFGTDDLYLEQHLARLIVPGGQLGIVVPGLVEELASNAVPAHLEQYWEPALFSLHSPAWWQRHWERSGLVTVELADLMPDGWRHWMASDRSWSGHLGKPSDEADMLDGDQGRTLGFTRMVAHRNDRPTARLAELQ
jgi:cyclopropane fatty-acyl-phospholipid synthase-like methyltransferase